VVPAANLQEVATERASALASRPAEAVRVTKRLMREPLRAEVHATLAREGAEFIQRLQSTEAQEAFMAFMSRGGKK
jgi:enoyl-CoA hydratase/carnithine racemase